jgi:hypothetical protein
MVEATVLEAEGGADGGAEGEGAECRLEGGRMEAITSMSS